MGRLKLGILKMLINRLLSGPFKEQGMKIESIAVKKDSFNFIKISIAASEVTNGLTLSEYYYLDFCEEYDCNKFWLYKRAKGKGVAYEIKGWNPSSYRTPITLMEVINNKEIKVSPEKLIKIFSKSHLVDRRFKNPFHR